MEIWLTQHFDMVAFLSNLSGISSKMHANLMTRPGMISVSISISVLTAAPCIPLYEEKKINKGIKKKRN